MDETKKPIEDLPVEAEKAAEVKGGQDFHFKGIVDPNNRSFVDPNVRSVVDPNF